jgi:hypothetical protein
MAQSGRIRGVFPNPLKERKKKWNVESKERMKKMFQRNPINTTGKMISFVI